MQVVYVDGQQSEITEPSIFLAGPTPRNAETPSWRPEALEILKALDFNGQVYVPERGDWQSRFEYSNQVEWEWQHLHGATVILFWVPREKTKMPGFTTNVEFGFYLSKRPDRCVYGRPKWAAKKDYLDWLYEKITGRTPETELRQTIIKSIELSRSSAGGK